MTSPQQPVEPWLASPADPAAPSTPHERPAMSPRLPMLIGLLTFVVSVVLLGAVAALGVTLGDQFARNVELRQLVSRIEASEAQMSEVQAQTSRALESYREGTLSTVQLEDELTQIARRGAVDVAAAGEQVAAVEWLTWHRDVQAAQLAYLAHNEAWVDHLTRAAADSAEFGRPQDEINRTFEAAQQPLLDAVPSWDLFDLRPQIEAIFAPGPSDGPTQTA